jgi:hypothetical protein
MDFYWNGENVYTAIAIDSSSEYDSGQYGGGVLHGCIGNPLHTERLARGPLTEPGRLCAHCDSQHLVKYSSLTHGYITQI